MSHEPHRLRRIVTGQNVDGRSCVFLDGPPAELVDLSASDSIQEIWTLPPGPLSRSEEIDRGKGRVTLSPSNEGVKLRWFMVGPAGQGEAAKGDVEAHYSRMFEMIGGLDTRHDTSRHPSMHLTQTVDFIILLAGKVRLLLDDDEVVMSPGDVVVQRGTNHAWVCESEEPALLVAVLIHKQFAD